MLSCKCSTSNLLLFYHASVDTSNLLLCYHASLDTSNLLLCYHASVDTSNLLLCYHASVDTYKLLLCYHASVDTCNLLFKPEPKKKVKNIRVWDIQAVKWQLGAEVCNHVLFLHSILGYDTTSRLHGL